jgi:hypothetical protein
MVISWNERDQHRDNFCLKRTKKSRVYAGLETLYRIHFPKPDPSIIDDLLRRFAKRSQHSTDIYGQVFTKPGVNPEAAKKYI